MAKIKLKKTLYLGLGGTGVSTILRVKKCFIDSYGVIPPMIGFLAIDSNIEVANETVTGANGEVIGLNQNELLICSCNDALSTYLNHPQSYDWVPRKNAPRLQLISGIGAGQVRSNGRFIAYYNYERIDNYIQNAVTKIHRHIPSESKFETDVTLNGIEHATTINIFGSLAGGTGSGMIVDTICLVDKAVRSLGVKFNIIPWVLMPDIFKRISSGPMMGNIFYNTYGALRTLDYLQHLNPADRHPINFGHSKIDHCPFPFAFFFNNINNSGESFDKFTDLLDIIAKSAFLPANDMGAKLNGPLDNIMQVKEGGHYKIKNKEAWGASTASAELIFDQQAVGRATADRTISQLCISILGGSHDGTKDANDFVDHQDVMIRENNGRDDVINYLLSPQPEYMLTIDESTTVDSIENYITTVTGQKIDNDLKINFQNLEAKTKLQLDKKIAELLDQTSNGCVGKTIAFVSALKTLITLCNDEMHEEQSNLNSQNILPKQWDYYIKALAKPAWQTVFGGQKYYQEEADTLEQELRQHVVNLREEKRRLWAIRFYNSLTDKLNSIESQLTNLSAYLRDIQEKYRDKLLEEQQRSSSSSKSQIYLHEDAIYSLVSWGLKDDVKAEFHRYFSDNGGLSKWLNASEDQIDGQLWQFAKKTEAVISAVNINIDDVLREMPEGKVQMYLQELRRLASPLWSRSLRGMTEFDVSLDQFIILGVGNCDTSILKTDPRYNTFFDTPEHHAELASTHQNDRIYLMMVEDLLPMYAINNYPLYEQKFVQMSEDGSIAAYIDEGLNSRMLADNFTLNPTLEVSNVLEMWVYAFIFGNIHFDEAKNEYWMKSMRRGQAIDGFRYPLGTQRDVAFNVFKTEGLHKEIEDMQNNRIRHEGNDVVMNKIAEVRAKQNYLSDYAQLSPLERTQLKEPRFESVRSLVERECRLLAPEY